VVVLSFEKFLEVDTVGDGFGKALYVKNFKERQNVSKSALDAGLGCKYIDVGGVYQSKYQEPGIKYACSLTVSFDAVLTVYEVNSRTMFISRFIDFTPEIRSFFEKGLIASKSKNVEARLVGMQNDQSLELLGTITAFAKKNKLPFVEIDLFGNALRHICFDVKTGTSFDVLANNRLYKPGELANSLTSEQFERSVKTP
jgi:hypothetical protein